MQLIESTCLGVGSCVSYQAMLQMILLMRCLECDKGVSNKVEA
jgi:hypothetical protein